MNSSEFSITTTVKKGLCTGCGTCIALCPNNALSLEFDKKKGVYIPHLDISKCNGCCLCMKICPGKEVNFRELNQQVFGKEQYNKLTGYYLNCYSAYSNYYDIRYNSSSGGILTQILISAIEEGRIDGALVTRMKKENPLEPEPFIATTKNEIIEASKSKYCPVPANIALREIINSEKGERFAVVGLPCHIHGIRKAESVNKRLKEKIVLHLGIYCSINHNFLAQDYLLNFFNINKEEIVKFDYRGEGSLGYGGMTIYLKDKNKKFYPYLLYWSKILKSYFIPWRCTLCSDQLCELADISIGDLWIPEFSNDEIGTSSVIARTKEANDLLNEMCSKNDIDLKPIEMEKIIESQAYALQLKKSKLKARMNLLKCIGFQIPTYNQDLLEANSDAYLHSLFYYTKYVISSKKCLWRFIDILNNRYTK